MSAPLVTDPRTRRADAVASSFAPAVGADGPSRAALVARGLLRAARPRQWVKNLLVFAAPLAAEVLLDRRVVVRLVIATAALCLAASSTYLLNDVIDASADRLHPTKRHRPIAAGVVSPRVALAASAILLIGAVAVGSVLGATFAGLVVAYITLTISYSSWLKRIPFVDVLAVASGFLLRAVAGAAAAGVPATGPFLLVVSFGALFLVIAKRHGERHLLGPGAETRAALAAYTPELTSRLLSISVAATVVSYASWAFGFDHGESGVPWMALSVLPFVAAMLRALQLALCGTGADPEDLLRDRVLLLAGAAVGLLTFLGLYVR
jgi:decaprenyl-phosphate phosphoribosyltransferase